MGNFDRTGDPTVPDGQRFPHQQRSDPITVQTVRFPGVDNLGRQLGGRSVNGHDASMQ